MKTGPRLAERAAMTMPLRKLYQSSTNYAVSRFENVLVVVHRTGSATPLVEEMPGHFERICKANPQVGLLLVVKEGCKPPEGPAREKTNELFRLYGRQLRSAVVMEGSGFWAAAIRSALMLISMSASHPMKIHSTVEEGVNWLCREMARQNAGHVNAAALLGEVDRLA
jgi:hypothetical protein